jgi:polar amino acid transport system substrate-binding protein
MSRFVFLNRRIPVLLLMLAMAAALPGASVRAQTGPTQPPAAAAPALPRGQTVAIATRAVAPFVMKEGSGLTGFSIDLWNAIAVELGIKSQYVVIDTLPKLLEAVRSGQTAAGVAAISITSQRGATLEFSQPMFRSGLSIMVPSDSRGGMNVMAIFFSWEMLKAVGIFALILVIPAHLIWLLARGRDDGLPIARSYFPGIFDAIFWCAESMAGAPQGHPSRVFARIAAVLWLYAGIVLIAYFTAFATTSMTMQSLRGEITGPGDLRGKRVAVVEGSTSAEYTRELGAATRNHKDFSSAAKAVIDGEVDAAVYDAPVIMYYVKNEPRAQMVGSQFRPEGYGIIFPLNSPLRRPVDTALLKLVENGTYDTLYRKWFGQGEGGS